MRQLQLFTSVELAAMRDRTWSRNYCPVRDVFRREHEVRRAWENIGGMLRVCVAWVATSTVFGHRV
jgi:hypothetical protein